MAGAAQDYPPTPSALMELQEERQVVREGHRFLDEKRLLLAAELLRQLETYERLFAEFAELNGRALEALRATVARHGLDGLETQPAPPLEEAAFDRRKRSFLGVPVESTRWKSLRWGEPEAGTDPSPEAGRCREAFQHLVERSLQLAAVSGNMERLLQEYRRTERRTRALEDVILPELEARLQEIQIRIEELDQEEAIRVRVIGKRE